MGSLSGYILRQIVGPLTLITLTLTSVIWLTQGLRLLDRLIGNGLAFGSFIYLTSLLMPALLTIVLPIAAFCATLFAYNRLMNDSEIMVMSAAGVGRMALARPGLVMALVLTAVGYFLVLYLNPLSASSFRSTQYEFRANIANLLLQEGVFNTPVNGLTVYIRERQSNGELLGILVHDNRDPQKPVTMMAERGALVRTPQGPRFVMVNGNRQQIEQDRSNVGLLYFDSYTLNLDSFARDEGAGWRQPTERYLHELFSPDMNDADDRANYWRLVVQGHANLAQPLYVIALIGVALAAMLASEFNRRGQSRRIALAAGVGIAVQLLSFGVTFLARRTPVLIPLVYLIPLFFIGGSLYLLLVDRQRIPPREAVA
jgi:lipopolysaccharide export system permease protein